jgi:MbtH protein
MRSEASELTTLYTVVVNAEEQYSIWSVGRECPPGWREAGKTGISQECIDYIRQVWTDMTPLSVRMRRQSAGDPAAV